MSNLWCGLWEWECRTCMCCFLWMWQFWGLPTFSWTGSTIWWTKPKSKVLCTRMHDILWEHKASPIIFKNPVSKSSLPMVPAMCNLTKSCASTSSSTTTTTKVPCFANPSTNNKLCRLLKIIQHLTTLKDLLQLLSFQNTERFPNLPALFQKLCASLAAQLCIKVSWHYVICSFHSN